MRLSFSLRLALVYVGLFFASVALLMALAYYGSIHIPHRAVQGAIDDETTRLERIYIADGEAALLAQLRARSAARNPRTAFHAFIGPDNRTRIANLPTWPATRSADWLELEADLYVNGGEFDQFALVRDIGFADGSRLIVGRDIEDIEEIREVWGDAIVWILASSIALGLLGSLLMSRAIGRRVETIEQAARTVMAGDLSGRVPTTGSGDEFDQLGVTLNAMLTQIEALFGSVRRVSDHVAHELRTPLARLLADVEAIEASADDDADPRLTRISDEARRLQRIFDSVLRIARLESGRHKLLPAPVRARALLSDVAELYEPAADAIGASLVIDAGGDIGFPGDRDLLMQALANLVDNALKYGGVGEVHLTARRVGTFVHLGVRDHGAGMPVDEVVNATERFYRGVNSTGLPGEGLGLSLVSAIAAHHAGRLFLTQGDPGLVATLELPAV